jgi:hypothetical protein
MSKPVRVKSVSQKTGKRREAGTWTSDSRRCSFRGK